MNIFDMTYMDEKIESKYLVEINAEQVNRLAELVDRNDLTEAMWYLSCFVHKGFDNCSRLRKTSVHDTDTYYKHLENLYMGKKFLKAIHHCENQFGYLPKKLKAMRDQIFNITLLFVLNDEEVLECAINESKTADE